MIQRGMRRPRKKFYISKRALRPGNVIFTIVNTLIMLCVIVVMLYPFWNTIAVFGMVHWVECTTLELIRMHCPAVSFCAWDSTVTVKAPV